MGVASSASATPALQAEREPSCRWIGAVRRMACHASRRARGSGQARIVVIYAQDEVGEFLRECGRLVRIATQAAQLVRPGLRDASDHQVVKDILECGDLLRRIGSRGFLRTCTVTLLPTCPAACAQRARDVRSCCSLPKRAKVSEFHNTGTLRPGWRERAPGNPGGLRA